MDNTPTIIVNNVISNKSLITDWLMFIAAGFSGAVLFFYTKFTYGLLKSSWRQIELQKEQLAQQEKQQKEQSKQLIMPFLIFKLRETESKGPMHVAEEGKAGTDYMGNHIQFSYRIVNVGRGPAIITKFDSSKFNIKGNKTNKVDNVIGPSSDNELEICFAYGPKAANSNALQDSGTYLLIEYKDIFGNKYKTEFKNCSSIFERVCD